MCNEEVLKRMINAFGLRKTKEFAQMVSYMHEIMYNDHVENNPGEFTEHDYESKWWDEKYKQLKSTEACIIY